MPPKIPARVLEDVLRLTGKKRLSFTFSVRFRTFQELWVRLRRLLNPWLTPWPPHY
jgi:hypothetical protein